MFIWHTGLGCFTCLPVCPWALFAVLSSPGYLLLFPVVLGCPVVLACCPASIHHLPRVPLMFLYFEEGFCLGVGVQGLTV